jgi:D-alanyl-D-alanine carboxypeptidase
MDSPGAATSPGFLIRLTPRPAACTLVRGAALILASLALHAADLAHRIDDVVDQSPLARRSFLGIHVVDLQSGKTLYAHNPDRLFLPASNMKLFVSALALEKLGPDYRFVTHLIRETGALILTIVTPLPGLLWRRSRNLRIKQWRTDSSA